MAQQNSENLGHGPEALSIVRTTPFYSGRGLRDSMPLHCVHYGVQVQPAMEVAVTPTTDDIDLGSNPKPPLIYRCKKCRRIIATEDQIVSHERGEGQKCFKWKKRNNGLDMELPECSSIFVEPMKWMQSVEEGCVEDKLQCIGCKARLGSFNWAGMQCNCGTWVNPAFQLHKSRVDESRL